MVDKTQAIDKGINNVGTLINHGVVQKHNLLHACAQDGTQGEHQQHNHNGADGRQRNVPNLLKTVGTVQGGGFIQCGVNIGDCRQEDNHIVSHVFPHIGNNDDGWKPGIAPQEHNRVNAKLCKQSIDHAVILEQTSEHTAHNSPGKKIRQEENGLRNAHEPGMNDFIEQQRQNQRHQQPQNNLPQGDEQGIAYHIPERGQRHHIPEIF